MKKLVSLFLAGILSVSCMGIAVFAEESDVFNPVEVNEDGVTQGGDVLSEFNINEEEAQHLMSFLQAFERLAVEVEQGTITNNDEAEIRLEQLQQQALKRKSTYTSFNLNNAREYAAIVLAVGPFDAAKAKTCVDKAYTAAANSGYTGPHNGKQDAFRHAYWNALMSREIGSSQAKEVADLHEQYNVGPALENEMDYHNNLKGRQAYILMASQGGSMTDSAISSKIKGHMNNGTANIRMKYIKNGQLVYTN